MANADDFKGLSGDMANAYNDRVKRIKDIKKDTKNLLGTCKEEDKTRATEVSKLKADADKLVKDINGDNKKLKADTQALIKKLTKESEERADESAKFIGECEKEDKGRAKEVSKLKADADKLVKDISGDNKKLKAATQTLIKELTKESGDRAADVAKLLGEYKKERVAAATAWKGLLSTMASTRKEKPSPIAAAEAKTLVETGEKKPAKKGKKRRKRKR